MEIFIWLNKLTMTEQLKTVLFPINGVIIYSSSSISKPVWLCLFWTQRMIIWRTRETEPFWGTIDLHCIIFLLLKSMVPQNSLIINFLQNIFLCVQNKHNHIHSSIHCIVMSFKINCNVNEWPDFKCLCKLIYLKCKIVRTLFCSRCPYSVIYQSNSD